MKAARKALATFIFATAGALIGAPVFDMDVEAWKLVASTGLGSLINFADRWAEAELKAEV